MAKRTTGKSAKIAKMSADAPARNSAMPRSSAARPSTRKPAPAKAYAKAASNPAGSSPRLLSGGNPQIAKADGDAPVQAYIAAVPGWKHDVARRLDALIVRTVPGVRKAVRWNSPFYGVESQNGTGGWFLAFHCITKYIKVTFFRGTSLNPVPPVESKVKDVRYVHIHEGDWNSESRSDGADGWRDMRGGGDGDLGSDTTDRLDEQLLASWIRQAAALPGAEWF